MQPEIAKKIVMDKNCYGYEREEISEKKLCCANVRYLNDCYVKCPSKTHTTNVSGQVCEYFICNNTNQYYNYEQDDCTYNITGYYVNDSDSRTIDKCHENCTACKGAPTNITTNCKECQTGLYIFKGNCYDYWVIVMIIAKMASMTRIKNYANALMKSVKNAMN